MDQHEAQIIKDQINKCSMGPLDKGDLSDRMKIIKHLSKEMRNPSIRNRSSLPEQISIGSNKIRSKSININLRNNKESECHEEEKQMHNQ